MEIKNNKLSEKIIDISVLVWLSAISVVSAIILFVHPDLQSIRYTLKIFCVFALACFIPYYIKRILHTAKGYRVKIDNDLEALFKETVKKCFLILPNAVMGAILMCLLYNADKGILTAFLILVPTVAISCLCASRI